MIPLLSSNGSKSRFGFEGFELDCASNFLIFEINDAGLVEQLGKRVVHFQGEEVFVIKIWLWCNPMESRIF